MLLESVEVEYFRNLTGRLDCSPGLNILCGENGQGKTNWLEAICLLAKARSFKTARLNESIRFGENLTIIRGRVRQSEEVVRDLQITVQQNIKGFSINGKKETLSSYLAQLNAVVFNSDELEIVRGLPEARRRFLDSGIVSLHPPFVQTFTDFHRVLRQKNALLQKARDAGSSVQQVAGALEPWNEQLASLAARIHKARLRFIERLNEVLERKLFGKEEISIRYVSSLEGKGNLADFENLMAERLRLRVQAELVAGHSLIGVHRDDMEILFDIRDIRKFGSSGQQRSALLILLLANIEVFRATRGEYPLFLLDDIDAELDYQRIRQLLDYLAGKTQTFVTTSKESFVERFGTGAPVVDIRNGTAKPRERRAFPAPSAVS